MVEKIVEFFQAYYHKQKLNDDFFTIDFLNILKEQSFLPYLFYVSDNPKFKKYYLYCAIHQESLIDFQKTITRKLNENHIDHLYVKGSILNQLYNDNTLRTRGDIDIFVDPNKIEQVKEILLKEGLELDDKVCMHHIEFKKGNMNLEVHYSLFDPTDKEYFTFFKNPFAFSRLVDGNCYELNYEEHFLYCLCHFARHLRTGAGLRYIFDFYYMLKKWEMDVTHLHQLISEFNFNTLYQNILNTIYLLTDEKLDIYEEKDVTFFIQYLLESGIHGFGANSNYDEKNYGEKKNKFSHIMSTIFMPNKSFRKVLYPKLGKYILAYPLILIHRIFYLITHKGKSALKFLFTKKTRSTKEKNDFYKQLGI